MVKWFSCILGLGASLGLAWTAWKAPRAQVSHQLDQGLGWLAGCLLAARIGFVLIQWSYYRVHWAEIPQLWMGGFSAWGALVGGLMTWLLLAWIEKRHPGQVADELLPLGMILTAAIWLASWLTGFAYGLSANTAWWGVPAPDEWGSWSNRFPVQWVAVLILLLALWGLTHLQNHLQQGKTASLGLFTIALSSLGLSFWRADATRTWLTWRYDTLASFIVTLIAAGLCLLAFWPRQKRSKIQPLEISDSTYENNHCSSSN